MKTNKSGNAKEGTLDVPSFLKCFLMLVQM